jgi:hypothetical protein
MPSDRDRRLVALEARLPPPEPFMTDAMVRKKLDLLCELACRRPKESPAEAIGRLFDIPPRDLADAMRSGVFTARWDEVLGPLRGLEGPAFAAACEDIRERHLGTGPGA